MHTAVNYGISMCFWNLLGLHLCFLVSRYFPPPFLTFVSSGIHNKIPLSIQFHIVPVTVRGHCCHLNTSYLHCLSSHAPPFFPSHKHARVLTLFPVPPPHLPSHTDIYVFGGTDAVGDTLGDFWVGKLALNAQLTEVVGLTWSVAPVNSGVLIFLFYETIKSKTETI